MNENTVLLGCRIWVIVYGDPAFTDLSMKIYGDNQDAGAGEHYPDGLIATSTNSLTKAQIITLDNGVKEIYFDWDRVPLQANSWYNFKLIASGYSPVGTEHLAWRLGYPRYVYETNLTIQPVKLSVLPFSIYFIGATF
jgi:hypothetical protein